MEDEYKFKEECDKIDQDINQQKSLIQKEQQNFDEILNKQKKYINDQENIIQNFKHSIEDTEALIKNSPFA